MPTTDVISKSLVRQIVRGMAQHLLGLDIVELTELPNEKHRVEARHADIVMQATDQTGGQFILHLELQNANHPRMPLRMLRYYTDIAWDHPDLPIYQYLIYTGTARLSMPDYVQHDDWRYEYRIVNVSDLDYQDFIVTDSPSALVLAILCDFKGQPTQIVLETILQRLTELLADTPDELRNHLKMMELLSANRNIEPLFKTVEMNMLSRMNIERMPSYQIGWELGEEIGRQKMAFSIANSLLQQGVSIDIVSTTTGLSSIDLRRDSAI